jgi:hypothetical protein
MMSQVLKAAVIATIFANQICAAESRLTPPDRRIIVLEEGLSLWQENREVEIVEGLNHLEFQDVPLTIETPEVIIRFLSEPQKFKVLESAFFHPQSPPPKSASDQVAHPQKDQPLLPAKITATVIAGKAGKYQCELLFTVKGLNVNVKYVALRRQNATMDLMGLASINNSCGVRIEGAAVYLPAESYSQARQVDRRVLYESELSSYRSGRAGRDIRNILRTALFLVPTPLSIEPQQIKNVQFTSMPEVPFKQACLYDGLPAGIAYPLKPESYTSSLRDRDYSIRMANSHCVKTVYQLDSTVLQAQQADLPRADAQVYHLDISDFTFEPGYLEFDKRYNRYQIVTGPHPDLLGIRKQLEFKETNAGRSCEETIAVTIRNDSSHTQPVRIREYLLRTDIYKIKKSSQPYFQVAPGVIDLEVSIEPRQSYTIQYTVEYEI